MPRIPYIRTKNIFSPTSKASYRLSRSRLENFINCPRCFYLDRRLGIEPPSIPAFTLNSAVDELLKREFDVYRRRQEPHPLMNKFGIDAVPFAHPLIDEWRENFKGVQFHHQGTNLIITGAVDDLWVDKSGQIYVVDYKSTSTLSKITLDTEYRQAYVRQMTIYQWLLRCQGFPVSDVGYFVYCNARKQSPSFEGKLEFDIEIIPHRGDDHWVEETIIAAHRCLKSDQAPDYSARCEYCLYLQSVGDLNKTLLIKKPVQSELFSPQLIKTSRPSGKG